ncbi:hypothetical protein WMF04_23915 [Sorangium sp. So ce260]|uniref:hypothetical protein n=1 Tax=Sorangium sp. So ce260 TaxID=3133291 RepID=UPI003F6354E8
MVAHSDPVTAPPDPLRAPGRHCHQAPSTPEPAPALPVQLRRAKELGHRIDNLVPSSRPGAAASGEAPIQRIIHKPDKATPYASKNAALTQVFRKLRITRNTHSQVLRDRIREHVDARWSDVDPHTVKSIASELTPVLARINSKIRRRTIKGKNVSRELRRRTPLGRGNVKVDLSKPTGKDAYVAVAHNYHQAQPGSAVKYARECASALGTNQAANCDQFGNAAALRLAQQGQRNVSVIQNEDIAHTWAVIDRGKPTEVHVDPWAGQVGPTHQLDELGSETYENPKNLLFALPQLTQAEKNEDPYTAPLPNPLSPTQVQSKEAAYGNAKAQGFPRSLGFYDQSAVRFGSDVSDDEDEGSGTDGEDADDIFRGLL